MKRRLFSSGCCLVILLATIFTSCKQEVPVPEMVTISYVSEFGTLDKTEKIVEKGYKLKADDLPELSEKGYTFGNWYINKKEAILATVETVINKDTVLVAKWNKVLDETAPKDVTISKITAADGKAVISWTIPSDMDSDLKGFELSMSPACGTLESPVILGSKVTSFSVDGLTNGTNYTFTIKTFDDNNNFSNGFSKDATPTDISDKTAPLEVTAYTATNLDGTVALKWTDPSDTDLFGIEITYTPKSTTPTRSIDKMVDGSIFIAPKTEYVEITKLANDTEYTFTFRTMDLSGNKSTGVSITCTPHKYKVGDIFLSDGSVVRYTEYETKDGLTPVAVVCGFNTNGRPLGLGLKKSETSDLKWANSKTIGWKTNFTEIVCTPSLDSDGKEENAAIATFTGDLDGSNNWDMIVKKYTNQGKTEQDALKDCPAFAWVNSYGKTDSYKLPSDYQNGWYMPSIAELTEIYRNKKEINNALNKLGSKIATELGNGHRLSSSQQNNQSNYVWSVNFETGAFIKTYKSEIMSVRCIRAF